MELKRSHSSLGLRGAAGYLHVDEGGYGDIPVLFVHSFGGSAKHWQSQLQSLRQNRRALAVDLRGHGLSDTSNSGEYTVHAFADDIAAVADQLDLKRFILVGHSIGGSAAIEYASLHASRVAGLILLGTPGKSPAAQSREVMQALESDHYDAVMGDYMEKLLTNASDSTEKLVTQGMKKIDKKTSLSIIKAAFDYNPLPALNSYTGPVMILYSDAEKMQPNALYKSFPGIQNRMIPHTSHWMQLDDPEAFNHMMEEFIQRLENAENHNKNGN